MVKLLCSLEKAIPSKAFTIALNIKRDRFPGRACEFFSVNKFPVVD